MISYKTAAADVSKGQTDISHKGELQTLTKLSMRHQICPSETRCTIISESTIMLMSGGRSNCGLTYYVTIVFMHYYMCLYAYYLIF